MVNILVDVSSGDLSDTDPKYSDQTFDIWFPGIMKFFEMDKKTNLTIVNAGDIDVRGHFQGLSSRIDVASVDDDKGLVSLFNGSDEIDLILTAGDTRNIMKKMVGVGRVFKRTIPPLVTHFELPEKRKVFLDLGSVMPTYEEQSYVDQLVSNAIIGIAYARVFLGVERPTFSIPNIGIESGKGTNLINVCDGRFREIFPKDWPEATYIGYEEPGNALYGDASDIVVMDGYMGNMTLKTMEATLKLVSRTGRRRIRENTLLAPGYFLLNSIKGEINPNSFAGAFPAGFIGLVMKTHGSSDPESITHSLMKGVNYVRDGNFEKFNFEISRLMTSNR